MSESEIEELFDYGSISEVVNDLSEKVEDEVEEGISDEELDIITRMVSDQYRRKLQRVENALTEEMKEDIRSALGVSEELEEINDSKTKVEENGQNNNVEITQEEETVIEETLEENKGDPAEPDVGEDLVDDELIEDELPEGIGIDGSYGVDTMIVAGYEVDIDGRSDGVHKEALYLAEQIGLIEDAELDNQMTYQAKEGLKDGGFTVDENGQVKDSGELPEKAREVIKDRLEQYGYSVGESETSNNVKEDSAQFRSSASNVQESEPVYTMANGTLEIVEDEQVYQINMETPALEALGTLTGLFNESRIRHEDEDTGSLHISQEHYKAISSMQDQGLVEGSEAQGFDITIDLPEQLKDELIEHMEGTNIYEQEGVYEAEVTKVFPGGKKVQLRYDNGFGIATSVDQYVQVSETHPVREAGSTDGQQRLRVLSED